MAMARCLSPTLIRISSSPFSSCNLTTKTRLSFSSSGVPKSQLVSSFSFGFQSLRNQSSQSENNNNSNNNSKSADLEALTVQRIEDAIHRIIVMRSAPDWLPFRPGSSYWVPPRRQSYGIAQLVQTLANNLTDDEVMSLTTPHGWPSSTFFTTPPASPTDASPLPSEEDATSTSVSQSEDEE